MRTFRPRFVRHRSVHLALLLAAGSILPAGSARAEAVRAADAGLVRGHELLATGDAAAARAEYLRVAEDPATTPVLRSLARLGLARAWLRSTNPDAAAAEFARVQSLTNAPEHLREEAATRLREIAESRTGVATSVAESGRTPLPTRPAPAIALHVAVTGDDAGDGSAARPFATLERARDALRQRRDAGPLPRGGAVVLIHGGRYPVRSSFTLEARDSGTAEAPVIFRRVPGETPVFSGGARVTGFRPVRDEAILRRLPTEARDKVMQADLRSQGITEVPPPRLGGFASGAGFQSHPAFEVHFDGRALPLARWPNDGFVRVVEARGPTRIPGSGPVGTKEGILVFDGDRPSRWREEPDLLLYGYWYYGWADSWERVTKLDLERRELTLAAPYHTYGYRGGQPWKVMNALAEIDEPGEWYLDRQSLTLYLFPPSDPNRANVEVSLVRTPMVEMRDVSHVGFEGLTWELGATDGLRARGGQSCLIAGCTVRRMGGNGIEFAGGTGHGIVSCDIHSMGRGGIVLSGGDRRTLEPGRHFVENCHISGLSRLDRTYTPAVLLEGVGNRIAHNLLHDIRSSALRIEGNDHAVEFNEIAHVVTESDDQGGVDMFGNPTYRGNRYRFNFFHHIGCWRNPAHEPECGQAGIRLDDMISGTLIYGNIFQRCAAGRLGFGGVQIHGGKENILDQNLFIDCATAVSFSPWGERTWRERSAGAFAPPAVDRDTYLRRYPELARFNEDLNVNHLWRNLVVNCGEFMRRNRDGARPLANVVVTNSTALPGSDRGVFGFGNAARLMDGAGFEPPPVERMGLTVDAFRPELPRALIAALRAGESVTQ